MDVPRKDEPRRQPGRHHQKLAIEYRLFSLLSNVTGSVFWWAEQKKWKVADQIDQHRWAIADVEEPEAQR
jgi:hypothetical protein